jgi:hypothetical protein
MACSGVRMIQIIDNVAITVKNLQETVDFANLGFRPGAGVRPIPR